jgi:nucleoside-diphosphate-sugar epimerase
LRIKTHHCARAARIPRPHPPSTLRRERLLIVGCGDVGLRVAELLQGRWRVRAVTRRPAAAADLRARGATPITADLDAPASLRRLSSLAPRVLHLAPPPNAGASDPRTAALLHTLSRHASARTLVYGSTTGVYGDALGARFDESRPVAPATDRARRRVDAEQRLLAWGQRLGRRACRLRIPGIYAADRPGGHPRERLLRGTPALVASEDVYTNHIHADDLARACVLALLRGAPQRSYHVCDDTDLTMGDYFDLVAALSGLPPPRRITRTQAQQELSPMQLSFMGESRRLINRRLKTELRLTLRYPTVREGLMAA